MNSAEDIPSTLGEGEVEPESGRRAMAGRAGWVGMLTLLSRICGLVRDSAIAYVLGTRAAADAFYVAFRIPNLLRRLVAEGNLTLSFVPVFTQSLHQSKEEARKVSDVTFTLLSLSLIVLTILGIFGSTWFVRFTAYGFSQDPEKFALTVALTKITFPYIFLVSIAALFMGILNARHHYTAPAFAPVLMNLGMIIGAFWMSRYFSNPSVGIAWGVILGGILQLAIQIPWLLREGFFPRLNFHFKDAAVKKILKLMVPSIYGSAVYQINLLAITFMASFLPTGAVSFLWYADRVVEFPLGIFAISFATVALPTLSEHVAKKDEGKMKKTFRETLSMVWLVNIPAAVGLAVLAKPILAVLFYRGDFTRESTELTAQALRFFAMGLPFVSATRITTTAFYALQESKKPVLAANIAVLVNILMGALLLYPLGHRGLALAVSLGSIANFSVNMFNYRKKVGPLGFKSLLQSNLKILLAAGVMATGLVVLMRYWDWSFAATWPRVLYLTSMIGIGVVVYGLGVLILRVEEANLLWKALRKKFRI